MTSKNDTSTVGQARTAAPLRQFRGTMLSVCLLVVACGGRSSAETRTTSGGTDVDATDGQHTEAEDTEGATDSVDDATDESDASEETEEDPDQQTEELDELEESESTDDEDTETDEPTETDELPEEEPPLPNGEPVWLHTAAPGDTIINLNAPQQRFVDLNNIIFEVAQMAPWSGDGRWLADSRDGALQIYDLVDGELAEEVEVDGISRVLGWMGNDFALAETNRGVSMIGLDGSVVELVPPPDMQGLSGASASPDGSFFVYTLGGGMGFPLGFVDVRDEAAPSEAVLLDTYDMAPALSFVWSLKGDWLAFGVPNQDGGIFVWNPAAGGQPTRISPDGTTYTPLHAFSPAGDGIVSYVSASDGPVLVHARLEEQNVGDITEVSRAMDQSPASWSPDGDFIVYSSEERGWLHAIDEGDVNSERIEIPSFNYSCGLRWLDSGTFAYIACGADTTPDLLMAEVAETVEPSVLIADVSSFEVAGRCLVAWDDDGLVVGEPDTLVELVSEEAPVEHVALEPNGTGLAWSVLGSLIFWQPMVDCTPVGEPTLVDAEGDIQQLRFLPR